MHECPQQPGNLDANSPQGGPKCFNLDEVTYKETVEAFACCAVVPSTTIPLTYLQGEQCRAHGLCQNQAMASIKHQHSLAMGSAKIAVK